MTKTELVTHVAERLRHLTHRDAEIMVDTIFESVADGLVRGDDIEIRGFGSIRVKNRDAWVGRTPKKGESVHIPTKNLPLFRIGRELHERINRTAPSTDSMEEDS